MMQPLDYRTAERAKRVRPGPWLSHMLTAAVLCAAAMFVDVRLRFDGDVARPLVLIEVAVATYGLTCAIVCLVRADLTNSMKLGVLVCICLYLFTTFVGLFMPRLIHN